MAALDTDSFLKWKEDLYGVLSIATAGHEFLVEALRSAHLEGKVGLRESIALKNVPPVIVEQRSQPGQG